MSTFRESLDAADRPLLGIWVGSASAMVAEICAGSGIDWLVLDMEHSPTSLSVVADQLRAVAAYPVRTVVRVPVGDTVVIKQVLDAGATDLMVPMVETAEQARALVAAVRYPPAGVRGVGAALSRSARWGRIDGYLAAADAGISLVVQIESPAGVRNAAEIAAVDGVSALFVGPADLAATLGHLGNAAHPDVVAAVEATIAAASAQGAPVGVNAFAEDVAERYLRLGARFVAVAADVQLLARGSEAVARRHPAFPAG